MGKTQEHISDASSLLRAVTETEGRLGRTKSTGNPSEPGLKNGILAVLGWGELGIQEKQEQNRKKKMGKRMPGRGNQMLMRHSKNLRHFNVCD